VTKVLQIFTIFKETGGKVKMLIDFYNNSFANKNFFKDFSTRCARSK